MWTRSLSSWRAWIEIATAEGDGYEQRSLSSWRAWIEIARWAKPDEMAPVALLMESVD